MDYPAILTPILSFAVGVIGPILVWSIQRRQNKTLDRQHELDVEVAVMATTQDAVKHLIQELQEEIASLRLNESELRRRVDQYRDEIIDYRIGTERLVSQITGLGHEPAWEPPLRTRPSMTGPPSPHVPGEPQ